MHLTDHWRGKAPDLAYRPEHPVTRGSWLEVVLCAAFLVFLVLAAVVCGASLWVILEMGR